MRSKGRKQKARRAPKRRARNVHADGKARPVDVYCTTCGSLALLYLKDRPRSTLRFCYVDGIFWPPKYEELKHGRELDISAIPNLVCQKCGTLLGSPVISTKGGVKRLAYLMERAKFRSRASSHILGKKGLQRSKPRDLPARRA